MRSLWEKMQETEPGRWAAFIHQLLYDHGDAIEATGRTSRARSFKADLLDLAHYLEKLTFAELEKEAAKEGAWIDELRERIAKL